MSSSYRPQSPDLSSYTPESPDLSGLRPESPDLSGALPSPRFGHHNRDRFGGGFGGQYQPYGYGASPTSVPAQSQYSQTSQPYQNTTYSRPFKNEDNDDEYLPDAVTSQPNKRARRTQPSNLSTNGSSFDSQQQHTQLTAPIQGITTDTERPDPTLGVTLKTSFPVARIKRIMQADEDIGKVAQVTPHVVSRALELFMIKLISASTAKARGMPGASQSQGGKGGGAPKRILAQHMKKAIMADDTFDFLAEIVAKVPDAPTKAKREAASDSEGEAAGGGSSSAKAGKGRGRGKKRKDSGDDF